MGQQYNTIFERVVQNRGVVNFRIATPEIKFAICKLTIETIHRILRINSEYVIPKQTLDDFVQSLLQTSNVLYELHIGELGTIYPFKQLREAVDQARLHLGAASSIFSIDARIIDRGQFIIIGRTRLEDAIDIIGGFPTGMT